MSDVIEFGSPEHIAGLSREALEQDFAWMVDRNHELESICDRLDAENADLNKRLETICVVEYDPHGRRVLTAIDQLRRDLSGYHGQLKAHSDLQVHCDRQRERIADLEGLYAKVKAENAKLRELVADLASTTVKCQEGACVECRFGNPTGLECTWNAHMRELGIEVVE